MHQTRAQSEVEASASHTRNRLLSATLSNLLDERKRATSLKALENIANKYDIDIVKLESLARFVNSPTIDQGTTAKTRDASGEQMITSEVSSITRDWHACLTCISRLYGLNHLIQKISIKFHKAHLMSASACICFLLAMSASICQVPDSAILVTVPLFTVLLLYKQFCEATLGYYNKLVWNLSRDFRDRPASLCVEPRLEHYPQCSASSLRVLITSAITLRN
jgi:hypothetical protein